LNVADFASRYYGDEKVVAFFDPPAQVFRITRASNYPYREEDLADVSSAESQSASPSSQGLTDEMIIDQALAAEEVIAQPIPASGDKVTKKLTQPPKKTKVARPPNAFILYRSHYHPILLEQRPDLMNNEISVMLGKQWRNEPGEVRAEWKVKADKIKKQHAIDNPGYQYAPRKPSEKKRRMTARKLQKLRATRRASGSPSSSDVEMKNDSGAAESGFEVRKPVQRPEDVAAVIPDNSTISINNIMPTERATVYPSRLKKNYTTDDFAIVFPAGHDTVEHDYNIRASGYEPRHPSEHMNFSGDDAVEVGTWESAQADSFMNSMIDWAALNADAKLIHDTVKANNAELEVLRFDTDEDYAAFQKRMNKVLQQWG
jgi:hypothetical protein